MSNSGQFGKNRKPPGRGKSFKTKLLETIRDESLVELRSNASNDAVEKAYLKHFATRAFDDSDPNSATLLKELLSKSYPSMKAVMPEYEFEFDVAESPTDQVGQIIKAASEGQIPPDVAGIFLSAIKNAADIELATDIKARITEIEKKLGISTESI